MKSPRAIWINATRTLLTWALLGVLVAAELDGLTLQDLRADKDLTPRKLMSRLSRFKFELHDEVQTPEAFLASESGDCDDFATLAALVLREKGYTPRLVAVRMPGLTHVVCYVAETGSYLDYNNRIYFSPLIKSKPDLAEIATKVAKSFDSSWTTASEFKYTNQVKILITTIARTESFTPPSPPVTNTRTNVARPPQLDISF